MNRYNTLNGIANNTNLISASRLREYKRMGLLPQPSHLVGTNLYDEEEIINLIPSLKTEKRQQASQKGNSIKTAFDLLNQQQQHLITRYLNFRYHGGIVEYNGYRSTQQISNKENSIKTIKQTLSSVFVLIISGRSGIKEDFHKNPFKESKTPESFNPDLFDIYDINQDDYFYISSKRKGTTLILYYHELRTFYYYLLDKMEDEVIDSADDYQKFTRFKRRVTKFLRQFPRNRSNLNKSEINSKAKTFLTREQIVMVFHAILEDVRARDPFKNATMWRIACTTGVRPEEFHKLRIEHFLLDSEGYLKLNELGWGELRLPAHISKQENSPSHSEFHTPIPPDTVKQLNSYLKILYKKQDSKLPKGKGFLFRPDDSLPEYQHKSSISFEFIKRLRPMLDFLDELQKQDFIFKSSRHSLNNMIMRSYIQFDPSLNGLTKRTVADHQLRHKPAKTVGEEYYLDDITKEQFYKILDATINFPWNIEKLKEWEIEKGYRVVTYSSETANQEAMDSDIENRDLKQQLINLDKQLQGIREKPDNLTEQQWIEKRHSIIKNKNIISNQLKGGGKD